MSKRLNAAISSGKVTVRPRVAGEVALTFKNPSVKNIILRAGEDTELTKHVPASLLMQSNLSSLISRRLVRIVG